MFSKKSKTGGAKRTTEAPPTLPVEEPGMTKRELGQLGRGHIAYLHVLTNAEARAMFPSIEELPESIYLFALFAADGEALALTDTRQAALAHAMDGELAVAYTH